MPAAFWVLPYLQNPSPTGMTVLWWTHVSQRKSFVEHGVTELDTQTPATNEYVEEMDKWLHEATLTALTPETPHLYRVRSGDAVSDSYQFRTAKQRHSSVKFSILGDGRTDDSHVIARHRSMVAKAASSDLIFELGDIVEYGSVDHWGRFLRRIMTATDAADPGATTGSTVPYHLVVGNHEIANLPQYPPGDADYYDLTVDSMERFKAIVAHPSNGSTDSRWDERYYVLTYGAVTFVVLDANNTSDDKLDNHDFLHDGSTPDWEPGSEQYRWLKAQLADAREQSVMTVVLSHPSPYSSGVHGTSEKRNDTQRGHELRALDPLFREYGVDAVISSHDHLAERSLVGLGPLRDAGDERNINYFVVGNSGSVSRQAQKGWEKWMSVNGDDQAPFFRQWHYDWAEDDRYASMLEMELINNADGTWTATFRVRRNDDAVFDEFSIERRDPRPGPPTG